MLSSYLIGYFQWINSLNSLAIQDSEIVNTTDTQDNTTINRHHWLIGFTAGEDISDMTKKSPGKKKKKKK